MIMGLFGDPKTKADWDKKIMDLNNELARYKSEYALAKPNLKPGMSHNHDWHKARIEHCKAELANAKIQRQSAPSSNVNTNTSRDAATHYSARDVNKSQNISREERENERKRLREEGRKLEKAMREEARQREKAEAELKKMIKKALDAGSKPAESVKKYALKHVLDYDTTYEDVVEERRIAAEKAIQQQKEKELATILLQYIYEKTQLSRAEIRKEITTHYDCDLSIYAKVEQRTFTSTYSAWIVKLVQNPQDVNRECLETLARLLDKNIDDDCQAYIEQLKKKEQVAAEKALAEAKRKKLIWILWGLATILILLQIIFGGWWTILTGPITFFIALMVYITKFT